MHLLCSLPLTPPTNLLCIFFFSFSPTHFSLTLCLLCEGWHNKANDNAGLLILKKKQVGCVESGTHSVMWSEAFQHPIFSSIHIKKCPFVVFTVSLFSLSLLHTHTHTHTHTLLQRPRLFLYKLCQTSVLPQVNHFLPKEANTFATCLEWAWGLCPVVLTLPANHLAWGQGWPPWNAEQSGDLPTLDIWTKALSSRWQQRRAQGWSEGPVSRDRSD